MSLSIFPGTNHSTFSSPAPIIPSLRIIVCAGNGIIPFAHFDTIATPLYIYFPFFLLPNYSTIVFVALPAPCQIIHDADNNTEEYIANFIIRYKNTASHYLTFFTLFFRSICSKASILIVVNFSILSFLPFFNCISSVSNVARFLLSL